MQIPYPFWAPEKIIVNSATYEFPIPLSNYKINYPNSAGLAYQAKAVRKAIKIGRLDCCAMTHQDSLAIAAISDELREQIGVSYAEDQHLKHLLKQSIIV